MVGGADLEKLRKLNTVLVFRGCGATAVPWSARVWQKQFRMAAVGNRLRQRDFVRSRRTQFSIPARTTTAASIFLWKISCA